MKTFIKSVLKKGIRVNENPTNGILIDPSHNINSGKVKHYFQNFHSFPGWLGMFPAKILLWLDFIQKKENISGNLFEIGVFCGKSAILFGLFVDQAKERIGLCDPFTAEERLKIPQKKILFDNLIDYFDNLEFIDIYEKASNKLTLQECKNCRLFHIDGGHTLKHLTFDLNIAENSIIDKGLIVIDDFFNPGCPEVTEGVYKYLEKNTLSPLMVIFTKLILCKKTMYNWYFEKINTGSWKNYTNDDKAILKKTTMFSHEILVFTLPKIQKLPTN